MPAVIPTAAPTTAFNPRRVAFLSGAAYLCKDVTRVGYVPKIFFKSPNFVCESSFSRSLICTSSGGPYRQLHARASKEKPGLHIFSASSSFFTDPVAGLNKTFGIKSKRRSISPVRAFKEDLFSLRLPVLTEKPEWWWRTLACVPYLIALQISDAGYYLNPLLEHHDFLRELIFFVPGAISRLPPWFSMVYLYFAYVMIVKNEKWPYFLRYHVMMGMLLETFLQIVWYVSNFMPLIHYKGRFGMYYWAGVGMAFIVVLLQCVRCALAGGYALLPFISDAAYIHTKYNLGGFQRPFK